METFWIIFFLVLGVGILAGLGRNQQMEAARQAYQASLTALKSDPTNAELRQTTLELGRKYSNLTRSGKGVALFDEVALMNDLNAAAGGTIAMAQRPDLARIGNLSPSASIEDRLAQISRLKEKGLIDEAEFQEKRAQILGDL